jgi:hypothetical protein
LIFFISENVESVLTSSEARELKSSNSITCPNLAAVMFLDFLSVGTFMQMNLMQN